MGYTNKIHNWNKICFSKWFHLTNLFQFRIRESTTTYVIVGTRAQNWKKLGSWNYMKEHI